MTAETTKPELIPMCMRCDTMHHFCNCRGGPYIPSPEFQAWREKFDAETEQDKN